MRGVSGEVCWGVGGGEGSCWKRYGWCGGRCREVCWEVRKDVWGVEKCARVHGVSGEVCWRVEKGCGWRNGGGVGKCVRV